MRGLFTALILAGALLTDALADAPAALADVLNLDAQATSEEIGRASCRERVCLYV